MYDDVGSLQSASNLAFVSIFADFIRLIADLPGVGIDRRSTVTNYRAFTEKSARPS
jgi:hypothetical protein